MHSIRLTLIKAATLFLLASSLVTSVSASTYYVSTSGNDSNPGTSDQPLKTIEYAVDSKAQPGDTIIVMPGSYHDTVSVDQNGLTILASDSGRVITQAFLIRGDDNTVKGFELDVERAQHWGVRTEGNNNLIENNEIYNSLQDGIWFFGDGNVFRGNYIHDIYDLSAGGTAHVDCFQTWGWNWGATNITFDGNLCVNLNPDNAQTGGGNQIFMVERSYPSEVGNFTIMNNIFVMRDPGYSPANFVRKDGQGEISNIHLYNNVFYHTNDLGKGQYGIRFKNITNASAKNNIFVNYGTDLPYIYNDGSSGVSISGNAWHMEDNSIPSWSTFSGDFESKNPDFMDPTTYNFNLLSTSDLIDNGVSVPVDSDYDGNLRPFGSNFDVGAYEYRNEVTATPEPDPTPTASTCTGDINQDGIVNIKDFLIFSSEYLTDSTRSDFNQDGRVDLFDFLIFTKNYLSTCS